MSDMFFQSQHTARKEYVCEVCGIAIGKGDEYILWKSYTGGTWEKGRVHIHCDAFVDEYTRQETYDGYYDRESVAEWIQEECCMKCPEWDEMEGCVKSPFCCEHAAVQMLHPTVHGAAIESMIRAIGR